MAHLNMNWICVKANSHAEDINQLTEDEHYWDGPNLCPVIFPWRFSSVFEYLKSQNIPFESITKLKISGKINSVDIRYLRELAGIASHLTFCWEHYEGEPLSFDELDGHLKYLDLSEAEIISKQWYRRIDGYDKHGCWSMGAFCDKEFSDYCHPYELDDWFIGSTTLEHLVLPSNIIRVNSIPSIKNLYAKPDSVIIKDALWEKAGLSKPIIREIEELTQSDDNNKRISNTIILDKQDNEKQHMANDKEKSEEPQNSNTGLKDEKTVENTRAEQIFKQAKSICEGGENGDKSLIDSHKAFLLFQEAAQMGNAEAQCCLGCCYRNGYGTQVDHQKARFWYDNSSNNGCLRALRHIAITYKEGQGVPQSFEKAVEWYTKAAEQGDATAQYKLGLCYYNGQGVSQSYEKAVEWFTKVAEQGNTKAQIKLKELGDCYYYGKGVPQNYEKAAGCYFKAAEHGHTESQMALSDCYLFGHGVTKNYEKAMEWQIKAAEQGDAWAQYNLGYNYEIGFGVPKSYEKAIEWYTKAAEQGNASAQINLGSCYYNGNGVPQSYEKAVEWYTKAAEQGYAMAQCQLGYCYESGLGVLMSYEKAAYWFEKAANQGSYVISPYILGDRYYWGRGVPQNSEKAVEWYTKAAKQGDAVAQRALSNCYYSGIGVAQNYEKALEWYTNAEKQGLGYGTSEYRLGYLCYWGKGVPQNYKMAVYYYTQAAEQGNGMAQCDLGSCYEKGQGVPQSYEIAVCWYALSALQGITRAQYLLGYCFENGQGVPRSYEGAVYWYTKAVEQGHADAKKRLGACYDKNSDILVSLSEKQAQKMLDNSYIVSQNMNNGFNPDQQEAILLWKDNHLVLAPPGCGKTRVLAERVTNAIDNGIKVEDMLCLTFTNRAAREMKERIDNRIGNEIVDNLFVGNVHHFCSTMLRENKVIVQKTTIIDDEEKSVIIRDIIRRCFRLDLVNVEEYYNFQHLLHQVEHNHPEDIIVRPELKRHFEDAKFMRIAREYTSYKKKYDLLDFEDLLLYGYDYLILHQNEVKRYSWIQVDEVQDLNRLQLAIIELVTAPNNPCVVYLGDEQQAIYSFMGAKLSTLSYLKDQCQGNIHHFHGNYRSPKYLLDIFNQYAEINLHVDKDILPQAQGENADLQQPQDALLMESCELREGFNENDFCAYDMAVERALSYNDGRTAILTYSNKDCDKISERLARRKVEHFKISGTDFLWTKEVKLIFSHLNVFTQPENIMSWANILMGIGVCQKMETAHQLITEANNACLRGNDLLDDARRNLIKNFIHDYPNEFVIFDTETTGLDVNNDDIVEIAAIHISNGIVVDELDLMLYTDKTIPLMLGDIENPLPDEYKKREKMDRKEGLLMFLNWVGNTPVLAHNAKYDYQILDANLQRDCRIDDLAKRWIKVHDSLAITRVVEPDLNSYKLKDLLATFNLQGKNSHLAIDDVKATKSLVDYCYKKANHVFILQNEFYANHREIIAKIKEQYGELYRHTELLLSKKAEEGKRNLLATETEYAYHYFTERGFIEELDKMKYLLPFLSEDFIPKEANLSLRQLLDKYMIELNTLRESDLCESKSLKDKVKVYISTVHRAKGLEFENVVVFDVRDGFYPFYEWNNILRDSSDPKERERAKQGIQEDARKLYVAISRAKKRLCIQYPRNNTGYGKFGWYQHPANVSPFVTCIYPMFK